jgi:NADP-dependent alcohol dehydrogenase
MIGHEITALHGVDHGRTLAIVLPTLLEELRDQKREKLIQFAERVWGVTNVSDDEKVTLAISKTRAFFESMHVSTRLSDYKITKEDIPAIINQLKEHGMVKLGEKQNVTPEVVTRILENSL